MRKTNFIRNLCILFSTSLFLFGCVAAKLSTSDLVSVKNQKPPEGKSLIYIVRPSSYFGAAIKFDVSCDKEDIGSTMGGQFIYTFVQPGKHELISKAENDAKIFLVTEPNKIYYLKQNVEMGLAVARNSLKRLNEIEGKAALNKCKLSIDCPAYEYRNLNIEDVIKTDTVKHEKLNENPTQKQEIKKDTALKASQMLKNERSGPVSADKNAQDNNIIREKLNNADKYYNDKNYIQAFTIYNSLKDDPNFTDEHWNTLGKMYYNGQGTILNYKKAKECFEKSAEKGNAKSMYNLGIMYYEGKGIEKNQTKAYEWFKKSADLGNQNAMKNLAEMSGNDFELQKDIIRENNSPKNVDENYKDATNAKTSENQNNTIEEPYINYRHANSKTKTKKERCATIGILQGGGSLIGGDIEFLVSNNFGLQVGAGLVGYGFAGNYHFQPTIRSSFISMSYWHQGIGKTFAQSALGLSYVYRGKRWFTCQLGLAKRLSSGELLENLEIDLPDVLLIYSIGGYFTF